MIRVVVDVTISEVDASRIAQVEQAQQAFLAELSAAGILHVRAVSVSNDPIPGETGFESWAQAEVDRGFDGGTTERSVE